MRGPRRINWPLAIALALLYIVVMVFQFGTIPAIRPSRVLWRQEVTSYGLGPFLHVDAHGALLLINGGYLQKLNADRELEWEFPTRQGDGLGGVTALSTQPDGCVLALNAQADDKASSVLHCLDANGKPLWQKVLPGGQFLRGRLQCSGKTLVVGTDDMHLSVSDSNGKTIADFDPLSRRSQVPLAGFDSLLELGPGGELYVYEPEAGLAAFSPKGQRRWNYPDNAPNLRASIQVADNGTVVFHNDNSIHALLPDGSLLWKEPAGFLSPDGTNFAVDAQGRVFVPEAPDNLAAYSPDHSLLWNIPLSKKPRASVSREAANAVVATDGQVFILRGDGELIALSKAGKILWREKPRGLDALSLSSFDTNPLVLGDDGQLYIAGWSGVMAIDAGLSGR
jgi:outer membrane protein assembly factor BamB